MLHFMLPGRKIETQAARAFRVLPNGPKPDIRPEPVIARQAPERIITERDLAPLADTLPPRQANGATAAIRAGQWSVHALHIVKTSLARRCFATLLSR